MQIKGRQRDPLAYPREAASCHPQAHL